MAAVDRLDGGAVVGDVEEQRGDEALLRQIAFTGLGEVPADARVQVSGGFRQADLPVRCCPEGTQQ